MERYSILEPFVTTQEYNGMQLWILYPPNTAGTGVEVTSKKIKPINFKKRLKPIQKAMNTQNN